MNKPGNRFCNKCAKEQTFSLELGLFAFITAASVGLAYVGLNNLVSILGVLAYGPIRAGAQSDYYSHILLIPFVSAYFLFEARNKVREEPMGSNL